MTSWLVGDKVQSKQAINRTGNLVSEERRGNWYVLFSDELQSTKVLVSNLWNISERLRREKVVEIVAERSEKEEDEEEKAKEEAEFWNIENLSKSKGKAVFSGVTKGNKGKKKKKAFELYESTSEMDDDDNVEKNKADDVPVGTIRASTGALFQIGGPPTDGSQNPGDGGGNRSQEQAEEMDDPVDWGDEESCEKKVLSEEEGDDEGEDPEV